MTARERHRLESALRRAVEQNLGLRLDPLFWRLVPSDDCFVDGLTDAQRRTCFFQIFKKSVRDDLPRILRTTKRLRERLTSARISDGRADSETEHRSAGSRGPYKGTLDRSLRTFAFIVEHEVPMLSLLRGDFDPPDLISWPPTLARWNRRYPRDSVSLSNTLETRWRRARNDKRVISAYAQRIQQRVGNLQETIATMRPLLAKTFADMSPPIAGLVRALVESGAARHMTFKTDATQSSGVRLSMEEAWRIAHAQENGPRPVRPRKAKRPVAFALHLKGRTCRVCGRVVWYGAEDKPGSLCRRCLARDDARSPTARKRGGRTAKATSAR